MKDALKSSSKWLCSKLKKHSGLKNYRRQIRSSKQPTLSFKMPSKTSTAAILNRRTTQTRECELTHLRRYRDRPTLSRFAMALNCGKIEKEKSPSRKGAVVNGGQNTSGAQVCSFDCYSHLIFS